MKITKKILCTFLVVVICLTAAPLQGFVGLELPEFSVSEWFASKASAASEGYYTYTITDGEATITDVNKSISGGITIPATLGGYSVTSIGYEAFYYCYNLTSVTIPDSVTTIGERAFASCHSLKSVTIPDSVTTIGDYAFYLCYSLTSVTIPDSVTTIGDRAFEDCDSLTSIVVDADNPAYSSDSRGALFDKNKTILIQYPIGNTNSSYSIPDSVTTIGDRAFYSCESLTSVTIPDSVTTIGDRAFYDCDSLRSIVVDINNSAYSNDSRGVLFNKNKTMLIQYPIGNTGTSYTIPDSVTTIGDRAFYGCKSLTRVTIPDSVTSIGYAAFFCRSLTSVTIPDSVTTIGEWAFAGCNSLTSVTIGDSVTTIGEGAFYDCYSLTDVYYKGTEEQWKEMSIGSDNDYLLNATIHYNHNHTYKKIVTVPPTCTAKGYTTYTCECGDTYTESIAKLEGHTYDSVVTAPTCASKGYTTYTCECGDNYVSDYVGTKPHSYTSTVTRPATHLSEGVRTYTCTACGDSYPEAIGKTKEHSYFVLNIVEPTCESEGYTTYECECGHTYNGDKKASTGHNYSGDTCVDCGKKCSCNCHKSGFMGFIWKIILFFNKLFKTNKTCACGVSHY